MTETPDFPQEPALQKLGRYEIRAELGRGGFATVYRALDPNLDREVALKVLHPQLLVDRTFVARFRKEARALANLRHPHIVTVYEVSEADGRLFIAMELAQGPSLADAIAQRGRIPWAEALDILRPVCTALDYAHSQGIVHRDLKPANILLDKERGPLLTDFGLARIMGGSSMSVSISGGIVGTPAYIAPEVWEEEAARPAADIYALGCVCYEMVTGALLFNGATPMHIMRAHDKGPQFAAWPAETPPGLEAALRVALAAAPGARYPSSEAFWHALNDVEANAQAAREQAEREAVAAQWQVEVEQAIADGEWSIAKKAVGRWLKLTPESEVAQAARRRIEGQEAREQEAREQEARRKTQEEEEEAQQAREAQEREAATVAAEEEAQRKKQEEEEAARQACEEQEHEAARVSAEEEAARRVRESPEHETAQVAVDQAYHEEKEESETEGKLQTGTTSSNTPKRLNTTSIVLIVIFLIVGLVFIPNWGKEITPESTATVEALSAANPSMPANPIERNGMYSSAPSLTIDSTKQYIAIIETEKGNIVIKLYADKVPNTVNNFVFLARDGFYDNTTFHRVIADFMAQAGDPTGAGMGGPGYNFADEFDPSLTFDGPGVLGMANGGANTNGSQFFITFAATPWLDGQHSVFGKVIEGLDVLLSISLRDPLTSTTPGDLIKTIRIEER